MLISFIGGTSTNRLVGIRTEREIHSIWISGYSYKFNLWYKLIHTSLGVEHIRERMQKNMHIIVRKDRYENRNSLKQLISKKKLFFSNVI